VTDHAKQHLRNVTANRNQCSRSETYSSSKEKHVNLYNGFAFNAETRYNSLRLVVDQLHTDMDLRHLFKFDSR
jgi:hypothetical protein